MALLNGPGELVSLDWRSRMEFYARQIAGGGGVGGGGGGATDPALLAALASIDANTQAGATAGQNGTTATQTLLPELADIETAVRSTATTSDNVAIANAVDLLAFLLTLKTSVDLCEGLLASIDDNNNTNQVAQNINQAQVNAAANDNASRYDQAQRVIDALATLQSSQLGGATEPTLLLALAALTATDANNLAITQSTADAIILALSYIENKSTTYANQANQNALDAIQYLDGIASTAQFIRAEVAGVKDEVNQQGFADRAAVSAQTLDLVARLTSIDGEISSTGNNVATRVETVVGSVDTSVNNVRTIVEDLRLQVLKLQEERQCALHTRETLKASDYLEANGSIFNYPSEPLRYRVRISNNTGDGERPDFRGFGFVIISPTLGYSISRNEWDQSVGPGESILLDVPSAGFQLTVLSTDPGGVTGNIQVSGYYSS